LDQLSYFFKTCNYFNFTLEGFSNTLSSLIFHSNLNSNLGTLKQSKLFLTLNPNFQYFISIFLSWGRPLLEQINLRPVWNPNLIFCFCISFQVGPSCQPPLSLQRVPCVSWCTCQRPVPLAWDPHTGPGLSPFPCHAV
jgi:hypothetical protein